MNEKETKHISKTLSLILRHQPELAKLTLQTGGWVNIDDLLSGMAGMNKPITRDQLAYVVSNNDKKRFTISEDGTRIRAAQGHSVRIESDLLPVDPPIYLFHGTAEKNLAAILREGLKPMSRMHVHLSADISTARKVGARHGKPVILELDTKAMAENGQSFYQADNGVWLTGPVSPDYLSKVSVKA